MIRHDNGTILRYDTGSTALMEVTSFVQYDDHCGRYYGKQCMGGSTGAGSDQVRPASEEDLVIWYKHNSRKNPTPPAPAQSLPAYPCLDAIAKIIGTVSPLTKEIHGGDHYSCPLCDGEGIIDTEAVATYGGSPQDFPIGHVGVQCYGIGSGHMDLCAALNGAPADVANLRADLACLTANLSAAIRELDEAKSAFAQWVNKCGQVARERDEARADKLAWKTLHDEMLDDRGRLSAERDTLRAEVARLRGEAESADATVTLAAQLTDSVAADLAKVKAERDTLRQQLDAAGNAEELRQVRALLARWIKCQDWMGDGRDEEEESCIEEARRLLPRPLAVCACGLPLVEGPIGRAIIGPDGKRHATTCSSLSVLAKGGGREVAEEAVVALLREFSQMKPEKPDHWSSCSQCERVINQAGELLAALPQSNGEMTP